MYKTLEGVLEEVCIGPGCTGVAAPGQYHVVKPLSEDIEMFIRFHTMPGDEPSSDTGRSAPTTIDTRFG